MHFLITQTHVLILQMRDVIISCARARMVEPCPEILAKRHKTTTLGAYAGEWPKAASTGVELQVQQSTA